MKYMHKKWMFEILWLKINYKQQSHQTTDMMLLQTYANSLSSCRFRLQLKTWQTVTIILNMLNTSIISDKWDKNMIIIQSMTSPNEGEWLDVALYSLIVQDRLGFHP